MKNILKKILFSSIATFLVSCQSTRKEVTSDQFTIYGVKARSQTSLISKQETPEPESYELENIKLFLTSNEENNYFSYLNRVFERQNVHQNLSDLKILQRSFTELEGQELFDLIEFLDIYSQCTDVCYDSEEIIFPFFNKIITSIDKTISMYNFGITFRPDLEDDTIVSILTKKKQEIETLRQSILTHIETQWKIIKGTIGEKYHILTDVDDTLYAPKIYKRRIAGIDNSYPGQIFYPGLIEFHAAINKSSYTSVLTARPKFMEAQMRYPKMPFSSHEIKLIHDRQNINILTGADTIKEMAWAFYSILSSQIGWGNMQTLANKKYSNCKEFKLLHPHFKLIFIGDNGQGDLIAAKKLLAEGIIDYSFIHIVKSSEQNERRNISENLQNKIIFFNNYFELANKVNNLNNPELTIDEVNTHKIEQAYTRGCQDYTKYRHCQKKNK